MFTGSVCPNKKKDATSLGYICKVVQGESVPLKKTRLDSLDCAAAQREARVTQG